MARARNYVTMMVRWSSGTLLMWSVLASSGNHLAFARQERQHFPTRPDGQAQLTARRSSNVMHVHVDDDTAVPQFDEVRLPPNLIVSAQLQQTVEAM
jgi:hypothetical protein